MKRDLKINYGILDDIINQLGIYKRSLSDMESSLSTITTYIEQNHGESIEAWKDRMKGSKEQMAEYETQINDLLNLFQGYVDDTTTYITPLQRNVMMRVDRNDIYWNLKQMESGIYNNVPKAISRTYKSPSFWGFWEDVTDAEKNASNSNKSRITSIRSDIELSKNRLNQKMDQLWDIYNSKVKKYENADDDYNNKASVLKAKYTNFFEGFWDSLEADFNFVKDLVTGLITGLIDIVVGLVTLVVDAGIVAISSNIPDIIEPKFLKDAANERIDSFNVMVQQIVEDPFSVVEGIAQSFSDSVEEEGIVYVTGNFAAGFVPVVGWSKYARIGRVLDTDQPKKPVNKTANKEGNVVDPVELLLVNAKKVGIEFTSGVINGMKIFREMLQGRNGNLVFDGGPGSGNVYRVFDESGDTLRRTNAERIDGGHSPEIKTIVDKGQQFTNGRKNKLKPNIRYKTGEYDYIYETDDLGRISKFETEDLQLTQREDRLSHSRNTPGKIKGKDHAGHLAGDRFGGSPKIDNLVSQLSEINLKRYKKIEDKWADALKDVPPKKVTVDVEIIYLGDNVRPDKFKINYSIDGRSGSAIFKNS